MLTQSDLAKIGVIFDEKLNGRIKSVKKQLDRIEKIIKLDFHYLNTTDIKQANAINLLEAHVGLELTPNLHTGNPMPS